MSKSEVVALSLIREAEVSTLSAEKEMQFVQVLNNVTLVDARKFLRWYMEKTSQFYLSCLEYLLDNNPTRRLAQTVQGQKVSGARNVGRRIGAAEAFAGRKVEYPHIVCVCG